MKSHQSNYILSFFITTMIAFVLFALNDALYHWFVLPIIFCGVLIGRDAVAWIKGEYDLYDPVGIIGIIGWHFFFLAPLLNVFWDHWMPYVIPLSDWRPWLGYMGILNLIGIFIYKILIRTQFCYPILKNSFFNKKIMNVKRFAIILPILLILTLVLQIFVWYKTGGILGNFDLSPLEKNEVYKGMGFILTFSESFPILFAIGGIAWFQKNNKTVSWKKIILFLLFFFIIQFLWAGLRGSRSATIWKLFWVVGMVHIAIKPLNKKVLLFGCFILILFMYIYGFYKEAASNTINLLENGLAVAEEKTGRNVKGLILGDFARSDVQAMVLHNTINKYSLFDYAFGSTYIGGVSLIIPSVFWPQRPPTKEKAGTDAIYGKGAWESGIRASNVYGLGGEAILNFGFLSVPISYIFLGMIVSTIRHLYFLLHKNDPRILLIPFWVNLCIVFLIGDSDNIIFFLINNGFVPMIFLYFCVASDEKTFIKK